MMWCRVSSAVKSVSTPPRLHWPVPGPWSLHHRSLGNNIQRSLLSLDQSPSRHCFLHWLSGHSNTRTRVRLTMKPTLIDNSPAIASRPGISGSLYNSTIIRTPTLSPSHQAIHFRSEVRSIIDSRVLFDKKIFMIVMTWCHKTKAIKCKQDWFSRIPHALQGMAPTECPLSACLPA